MTLKLMCQRRVAVIVRVEFVTRSVPHTFEAVARKLTRELIERFIEVNEGATWGPQWLVLFEVAARSTYVGIRREAHFASVTLTILLLHEL